jgi:RimJ/RimL family protein N-acetyltransferase
MVERPTLHTERLTLRPFQLTDAAQVQQLAGDKDIASTTLNIPHPYEDGMAQEWIEPHQERFEKGLSVVFAITDRAEGHLMGAIGLELNPDHERAELGYWVGKPYWNQGYCSEAARAVLEYAFRVKGLNRVYAMHILRNPSSGRVMQKIGMTREGTLREHVKKWEETEDLAIYGILKEDFESHQADSQ